MSIFKIILKPIVKNREWEISYVKSSRKEKVCTICGFNHPIGDNGTTFNRVISKGTKHSYTTYHTCGHKKSPCTIAMAKQLNVTLP